MKANRELYVVKPESLKQSGMGLEGAYVSVSRIVHEFASRAEVVVYPPESHRKNVYFSVGSEDPAIRREISRRIGERLFGDTPGSHIESQGLLEDGEGAILAIGFA